jgi:hypothetical protein
MKNQYTAKIYCDSTEITHQSGNDLEKLHVWMLTYAENITGDLHGEIIDNITHQVIKQFKKRSPE